MKRTDEREWASNVRSISFTYCSKTRIFDAALRVAARKGIRALTIGNIATEASRAISTVGRYGIEAFVAHVVDASFPPLVAAFDRDRLPRKWSASKVESIIDELLDREPGAPSLMVQAHALAACDCSHAERLSRARKRAEESIGTRMAVDGRPECDRRVVVETYTRMCLTRISTRPQVAN